MIERHLNFTVLCPSQINRRDETRWVSTMNFPLAGVQGPVFAKFWYFSVVGIFSKGRRTLTNAMKLENFQHVR